MRLLDRYTVRQLLPVWFWCLLLCLTLSCLIDLFGRLDEILQYRVPAETIVVYYLNFIPLVLVRASPIALLFSSAFVTARLSRHQELLAMRASGTSLLRASFPVLFFGWLVSLSVFAVNDLLVPHTAATYEQLKRGAFRGQDTPELVDNVAFLDAFNRLYHAKHLDVTARELRELTVLEHGANNRPTKRLYANRAVWTPHGWLLLQGTIYRPGVHGGLAGEPERFVERLINYPVTPESFSQLQTRPETMRYTQLRRMIIHLKHTGMDVRRYVGDLASKVTLPLMNLMVCLIAFVGSARLTLRGHVRGLGTSLGWGLLYYVFVGFWEGVGKRGVLFLPVVVAYWAPHLLTAWWCLRSLRRSP